MLTKEATKPTRSIMFNVHFEENVGGLSSDAVKVLSQKLTSYGILADKCPISSGSDLIK